MMDLEAALMLGTGTDIKTRFFNMVWRSADRAKTLNEHVGP